MNIGWLSLGKLGLPCALTMAHYGHTVYGTDINPDIKRFIDSKSIPYQEAGVAELFRCGATIHWCNDAKELADRSDIIFVAVQTPHGPRHEGITKMPDDVQDFEYGYLREAIKELVRVVTKGTTVVVVSTVLPGTMRREIMPYTSANPHIRFAYSPAFIAMGTTSYDWSNPEMVLVGTESDAAFRDIVDAHRAMHNAPIVRMRIESAEMTKMCYNGIISSKIVMANTIMEMAHKIGADCDEVVDALSLARERIISPRYMRGGGADAGGCFPAGSLVMTAHGPRPIESIEPGMLVMVGDGTLKPVVKRWERQYSGLLCEIAVRGMPYTRMTNDHPVLASNDLRPQPRNYRRNTSRKIAEMLSPLTTVPANAITTNHVLAWPVPQDCRIEAPEHATLDYVTLAGWYLSEGHIDGDSQRWGRLCFSLHANKVGYGSEIRSLLTILGPIYASKRGMPSKLFEKVDGNKREIRYGCLKLAQLFEKDFARVSHLKKLPSWILFGDIKYGNALLRGLWCGDGYFSPHRWHYSTTSTDLAYGVLMLLHRNHISANLRHILARTGQDGVQHRASFEVRVNAEQDKRALAKLIGVDYPGIMQPKIYDTTPIVSGAIRRHIRSVRTQEFTGTVYNLWVQDIHEYVVPCGVVHNCHPRDLIALSYLANKHNLSVDMFGWLMHARDHQTDWIAQLAQSWSEKTGLSIRICGREYKKNTNLTIGSGSRLLMSMLPTSTTWCDNPPIDPAVFVIGVNHDKYAEWKWPAGSVVIDVWRYIKDQPGVITVRIGGG